MPRSWSRQAGRSLQELAVDVVTDIHKLTTGLAHAGAAPKITAQIEQTSMLFAGIAKTLASGPVGQQPSSPGAEAPPAAPGGPPQAQAPAPPPNPGASPPGPGTPMAQSPAQGGLHNAIAQMHKDAQNAATKTAGQ